MQPQVLLVLGAEHQHLVGHVRDQVALPGPQHLVAAALVVGRGRVAVHQLPDGGLELGLVVGDRDVAQVAVLLERDRAPVREPRHGRLGHRGQGGLVVEVADQLGGGLGEEGQLGLAVGGGGLGVDPVDRRGARVREQAQEHLLGVVDLPQPGEREAQYADAAPVAHQQRAGTAASARPRPPSRARGSGRGSPRDRRRAPSRLVRHASAAGLLPASEYVAHWAATPSRTPRIPTSSRVSSSSTSDSEPIAASAASVRCSVTTLATASRLSATSSSLVTSASRCQPPRARGPRGKSLRHVLRVGDGVPAAYPPERAGPYGLLGVARMRATGSRARPAGAGWTRRDARPRCRRACR